ncbi:MAG: T9SS type A sorting domain-containing protein, partial [Saprospiraceae bacterium]
DNVSGITLIGNEGTNSQWVVTDDQGNILGLPPSPEAVNFDDAPAGTCLIWHLSFEDGLEGAMMGANAGDLVGCFNLSNPIEVIRNEGDDCNTGGPGDNDYVLVGLDELDIERNIINSGGIGAVDDNGDVEISEDSEVIAPGTFVKGDDVEINSGSMVNNVHAIPAMPSLPDFLENDNNVGNDLEVEVDEGETITLTESIYEDIEADEGSTIIFSGQENVYIEDLETKSGVTIIFEQCTNLILSGEMYLNYDNTFNPTEQNVFVFADDDISIRAGSSVYGVIYTDEKLRVRKGSPDQQTNLYGMFIGEDVRSRDYANYWFQSFTQCDENINTPNNAQNREDNNTAEELATALETVKLSVYPNPATDIATININKATQQSLDLAIYSTTNKMVSTNMTVQAEQDIIELNVSSLPAGVYFVKAMLENGEVVTEKLIVTGNR